MWVPEPIIFGCYFRRPLKVSAIVRQQANAYTPTSHEYKNSKRAEIKKRNMRSDTAFETKSSHALHSMDFDRRWFFGSSHSARHRSPVRVQTHSFEYERITAAGEGRRGALRYWWIEFRHCNGFSTKPKKPWNNMMYDMILFIFQERTCVLRFWRCFGFFVVVFLLWLRFGCLQSQSSAGQKCCFI